MSTNEDRSLHDKPTCSSRDRGELRMRLQQWMTATLGSHADPQIGEVSTPSASGVSSDTLLFDAAWTEAGKRREVPLVARVEPDKGDVCLFPDYNLEMEFKVMRLVGDQSQVPVPPTLWYEPDPSTLGAQFIIMEQVTGRVPSDLPLYVMEGWLLEASPEEQHELQEASVGILAGIHGIDINHHDVDFLQINTAGETALYRHFNKQLAYYDWVRGERVHPVIEDSIAWLKANWPDMEGPDVISWGDSRLGNVMYGGFQPVAVLDWEMASIAPREIDIGWMIYMHTFFQYVAEEMLGLPGLPDFLRAEDITATYEKLTGHRIRNLHWFVTYAAALHAIIMSRHHARSVYFGEAEWPEDVDETIPQRELLRRFIR
jgi:aminoglycoside phosphotransferase (APT) family kinase protein